MYKLLKGGKSIGFYDAEFKDNGEVSLKCIDMNSFHNLKINEGKTKEEKDKILNIMLDKFNEEMYEFSEAFTRKDTENMKEELCDIIQSLYGMAQALDININNCIEKHNKKLLSRGHEFI